MRVPRSAAPRGSAPRAAAPRAAAPRAAAPSAAAPSASAPSASAPRPASSSRTTVPVASIVWLLFATVAYVQIYLLLHEAGHALAAWSVGGTVLGIDARPWSPRAHAAYDLHAASDAARAFITAAGTLLPYAVWALVLGVVPRRLPAAYAWLRFAASLGILVGLVPWMVLVWPAFHAGSSGDDTVRFALTTGWPPAAIAALAATLFVVGAGWAWWRSGGLGAFAAMRRSVGAAVPGRVVVGTALLVVALAGLAVGLRAAFPGAAAAPVDAALVVPAHTPLADRTFAGGPVDTVLAEGVAPDGVLHLVLGYDEVTGGPLQLQVVDAAGAAHGVGSFGPGTTMGRATSRPRPTVAPGPWSLRLTADELRGRVRVWEAVDGR